MSAEASFHSRRRRRTYSEEESPLSGWKLGAVIGVVIMCFAMLYPNMFHPLLSSFFLRAPPAQKTTPSRPPIHPAMSSPRSRHDIHPGMRMAASQPELSSTPPSSKGMFAWMLPIYTAGVVAFLIYTLVKSKKKRRSRRHDYSSTETESDEDYDQIEGRTGDSGIGKRKLKGLQERLRQTELAMEKILQQLNTISVETANAAKQTQAKEAENEKSPKQCLDRQDGKTEQYLRDLEKALRDFKQLSKSYKKQEKDGDDENSASDADVYNDESVDEEGTVDVDEQSTVQEQNSVKENLRKRTKS